MWCEFKKGYSVYKLSNKDIAVVTPHSGPALEDTTSRDDNSETVASICSKKMGGKLVISNVSRNSLWGIDFNRDIPSMEDALNMFKVILSNKKEAIKLTNSHYQDQLSRSFMQSIIDYFTERKIKGSYFYASKNSKTIKVIPGDNLIKIASRNNTTVTDIVNLNKLKSKRLAIGQKIILPGT